MMRARIMLKITKTGEAGEIGEVGEIGENRGNRESREADLTNSYSPLFRRERGLG